MRKYHENTNLKAKRYVRKGEKKYKSKGLNLGVKKRARQGSNRNKHVNTALWTLFGFIRSSHCFRKRNFSCVPHISILSTK